MKLTFVKLCLGVSSLLILGACSDDTADSSPSNTTDLIVEDDSENGTENYEEAYEEAVSNFIDITPDEVNKKINDGDSFYLYTGRITCPYCLMFVPKLSQASNNTDTEIYYLDVENSEIEEGNLENFIEENDIVVVPDLLYFEGENFQNRLIDFQSATIEIEEIRAFLEDPY